jgi:hypothetical protein
MEICIETTNLVKIGEKYRKFTGGPKYVVLKVIRSIFQLDNSAKGTHCYFSLAKLNSHM